MPIFMSWDLTIVCYSEREWQMRLCKDIESGKNMKFHKKVRDSRSSLSLSVLEETFGQEQYCDYMQYLGHKRKECTCNRNWMPTSSRRSHPVREWYTPFHSALCQSIRLSKTRFSKARWRFREQNDNHHSELRIFRTKCTQSFRCGNLTHDDIVNLL